MRPEAKESPPPTRSRISRSGRVAASREAPSDQQMAPQSLRGAVRPPRKVEGTPLRRGDWARARAVIRWEASAAGGGAGGETGLGEIEAVAAAPADAVGGDPPEIRQVAAPLQHQILDEAADGVIDDRLDDGRAQPEAAAQAAGDVVLPSPLPRLE